MMDTSKSLKTLFCIVACLVSFATSSAEIISSDKLIEQLKVNKTRNLGSQSFGATVGRANMNSIQFEYNSSDLTEEGRLQINELATAIKALDRDVFQVIGHTDASGSDQYNLTLSQRRAKSVYDMLVKEHGVDPSRLKAVGKGESAPVNSEKPNSAENRRVEAINVKVLD